MCTTNSSTVGEERWFFREEVDPYTHGVEFLEEELARVRHGDDRDLGSLTDGAVAGAGRHGATLITYGDAEGVRHVKETLKEEARVAVGDHAVVGDDAIGKE